jgi:hypothetical protein
VSLNIPLQEAPELVTVTEAQGSVAGKCPGVEAGIPTAEPGVLCVYRTAGVEAEFTSENVNPSTGAEGATEAGPTGTLLSFSCASFCLAYGTWAVAG